MTHTMIRRARGPRAAYLVARYAWTALALAVTGCRACATDPPEPSHRTADSSDASSPEPRDDLVRVDCDGLEPRVDACPASRGDGDALIRFSEKLTEVPARHLPPPPTFWDEGRAAVQAASPLAAPAMGYAERVHVQNAALHLALAAAHAGEGELSHAAVAVVRKLAFPVDGRPRRAPPPASLEAWLGPSASWTERSKPGPMFHETVFSETRLLRMVRTPSLHANFTELLAVDAAGHPFLTSVVGSIEIRRGDENTAPACVALASPERMRCGAAAGVAAVRDVSALPKNHFFGRAAGGRLPCNGCHSAAGDPDGLLSGTINVDAASMDGEIARREALLADTVAGKLAPLWR